jgi:hypothetical protein
MKPNELSNNEFSLFYATYIEAVSDVDLIDGLENGLNQLVSFFTNIPFEKLEYRYAENK